MADIPVFTIKRLREVIDSRTAQDLDYLVFIDGHKGFGKSCLAYWLGSCGDPDYSIEKNFSFKRGKDEIIKKHMALKKYKWLNVDEGQRSSYKMGFMNPEQIGLWQYYNESRKANICTTWCTPDFMKMGSDLVGIGDMRIHVFARGLGVIFFPYENAINVDRWKIKECTRIWEEETAGLKASQISNGMKAEVYSKFPTYFGIVQWPDWPAEVKKEYLRLDAQAKAESLAEEQLNTQSRRDYLNFGKIADFANANGFSQDFLASYLKVSKSYVSEAISQVRSKKQLEARAETELLTSNSM